MGTDVYYLHEDGYNPATCAQRTQQYLRIHGMIRKKPVNRAMALVAKNNQLHGKNGICET